MIKNAKRVAALALLPILAVTACDSFLDVNKDPNAPVSARVDLTLPSVIGYFGHSLLNGSLAFWTTEWLQQYSFNGTNRAYSNLHRYEITTTDAGGPWSTGYANVMKEAKNIMTATEGNENESTYHGIAKFMTAWTFSIMTDAWGPIPFTDALDPTIREPRYDEQKVVYEGVFKMIDEAVVEMQKGTSPGSADLLYKGDMTKWVKLARTIQGQLHMRLTYAPGENRTDRATKALAALAQGFSSNADDADFAYPGGNNRRPSWYAIGRGNNDGTFVNSEYFILMLQERTDPRIGIFARPAPSDTPNIVYRGHRSGSGGQTNNQFSRLGNFFVGDSASTNWVSFAHLKFLEAEARLYVGGAAAADAPYRAGIRANMEKMAVPAASIDAYLAARPSLTTVANPLAEIMREKYIANFLKLEVWNDWRRTGFPVVAPITSEYLNQIPQRIRTPDSEITSNSVSSEATGIPTTLQGMLTKVWWASGQ